MLDPILRSTFSPIWVYELAFSRIATTPAVKLVISSEKVYHILGILCYYEFYYRV
jgi:hypothetical protein